MTVRKVNSKLNPYESNEYLLLRAGSAENGDPRAANLLQWINRNFEALKQSPAWIKPRRKPGFIYAGPDRTALPTLVSVQRVIKLIEAFAWAGATLKNCLEKWPDRDFFDNPPTELLAAYRQVNRRLHAYRGEYGIDTHHKLRQPAFDKFIPKKYLAAEIRDSRKIDTDGTAGLLLSFVLTGRFPFGEQQAVADLVKLIQDQRFHLLRKCNAPVASQRGEREVKKPRPCGHWFLASRIDQKFCSKACSRRDRENTPEFRNARKVWAREHYAEWYAVKKPKPADKLNNRRGQ